MEHGYLDAKISTIETLELVRALAAVEVANGNQPWEYALARIDTAIDDMGQL